MFKKAFVLSAYNWQVMLKALVCQVLILALIASLCFMLFGGLVEDCLETFSALNLDDFIADTITAIISAEFDVDEFSAQFSEVVEQVRTAIESIPNVWNRVEVSYVACVFLFFVYRMLVSLPDVSVGCQIDEFMTSNATRPFSWYFVKKWSSTLSFVCLQTLLALPLDLCVILISASVCVLLALFMGSYAVIPALVLALVLYSVRHSYFAFWLPTLSSEKLGASKSLIKSVSLIPYRFWHVFWKTLVLVCLMAACISLSVVFLDNNLLKVVLCTVPNFVLFFILKCVNFVEYFNATNRPFFSKKVNVEGTEGFNKKAARKARAAAKRTR